MDDFLLFCVVCTCICSGIFLVFGKRDLAPRRLLVLRSAPSHPATFRFFLRSLFLRYFFLRSLFLVSFSCFFFLFRVFLFPVSFFLVVRAIFNFQFCWFCLYRCLSLRVCVVLCGTAVWYPRQGSGNAFWSNYYYLAHAAVRGAHPLACS